MENTPSYLWLIAIFTGAGLILWWWAKGPTSTKAAAGSGTTTIKTKQPWVIRGWGLGLALGALFLVAWVTGKNTGQNYTDSADRKTYTECVTEKTLYPGETFEMVTDVVAWGDEPKDPLHPDGESNCYITLIKVPFDTDGDGMRMRNTPFGLQPGDTLWRQDYERENPSNRLMKRGDPKHWVCGSKPKPFDDRTTLCQYWASRRSVGEGGLKLRLMAD